STRSSSTSIPMVSSWETNQPPSTMRCNAATQRWSLRCTSASWPTTRADASTRSPMAHLLSALPDLDRHNGTADQHTAEVTFTPTGHRPQGLSAADLPRKRPGPDHARPYAQPAYARATDEGRVAVVESLTAHVGCCNTGSCDQVRRDSVFWGRCGAHRHRVVTMRCSGFVARIDDVDTEWAPRASPSSSSMVMRRLPR